MADPDSVLDGPFEMASNRSFKVLLAVGVALLVAVAIVGRTPMTTVAVALYLLAVPVFVAVRGWLWTSSILPDSEAVGDDGESDGGDDDDTNGGDSDDSDADSGDDTNGEDRTDTE